MGAVPARADPPLKGMENVAFGSPLVLCDTREQVQAIYQADQKDPEAGGYHAFLSYFLTLNKEGEHTCFTFRFKLEHITDVVDLGPFHMTYHAWLIVGGNAKGDGAALYVEKDGKRDWAQPSVQGSSI